MRNRSLKIWSCITLLLVWSFAGLQGDVRLESWTSIEAAAQPPQECKDAAGMTIPCPPADDGDRGRTDCQDTDRDGVCDSQEPSECVGQLDELGNGCAAKDDVPGIPRQTREHILLARQISPSYPQPACNDPDGAQLVKELTGTILSSSVSPTTGCPDPEPVFDCNVNGPFAFCNTFAGMEPEGGTESKCTSSPGGSICCNDSYCACEGTVACKVLQQICGLAGGSYEESHEYRGDCKR